MLVFLYAQVLLHNILLHEYTTNHLTAKEDLGYSKFEAIINKVCALFGYTYALFSGGHILIAF